MKVFTKSLHLSPFADDIHNLVDVVPYGLEVLEKCCLGGLLQVGVSHGVLGVPYGFLALAEFSHDLLVEGVEFLVAVSIVHLCIAFLLCLIIQLFDEIVNCV